MKTETKPRKRVTEQLLEFKAKSARTQQVTTLTHQGGGDLR